ncbi:hypothetical protein AWB82_06182 [Caballeronia glebae]|uniref:Uncharacterized protein n=1 Tax=Caballeronia glebae TaxID=1777143 RepID=A0A158D2F3_9BURK|nr:hypothetical protein [Caballeronia glebae]SAK88661.1 hypothetical protein AWB82_06182 [Caballeronia glebae]
MNTPQTTKEHRSAPSAPIVRPYAKRGTKTEAREAARKVGQKTFLFACNTHGLTVFGTAGDGHCRECTAARKRAAYERQKRAVLASAVTTDQGVI